VLNAIYTPEPVSAEGPSTNAWSRSTPTEIRIVATRGGEAKVPNPQVKATAQALWHGSTLYVRVTVVDPQISTSSNSDTRRSGVQIFIDQFDDKFPKFEEDDGTITVSADGKLTGNRTNAGLKYFPTVWASHVEAYAAAPLVGASRGVDALEYLAAHDPDYASLLDLKKLVVTGFSRWGKAALVAGLLDDR
jgi:hypothetical protein